MKRLGGGDFGASEELQGPGREAWTALLLARLEDATRGIGALQELEKLRRAKNGGSIPLWAYRLTISSERRDNYFVPKISIDGLLPREEALKFMELKRELAGRVRAVVVSVRGGVEHRVGGRERDTGHGERIGVLRRLRTFDQAWLDIPRDVVTEVARQSPRETRQARAHRDAKA